MRPGFPSPWPPASYVGTARERVYTAPGHYFRTRHQLGLDYLAGWVAIVRLTGGRQVARAYRGRGRSTPADVAARMLTYQVQGTSATRALALERAAGRGMQRQRWFALWNDLRDQGAPGGSPPQTEWPVKHPGGYVAFVVVMVAPTRVRRGQHATIEAIHVAVHSRRRRSQKWYAQQGLEMVARSTRRYRRAPIAAYVSSVAKLVPQKGARGR